MTEDELLQYIERLILDISQAKPNWRERFEACFKSSGDPALQGKLIIAFISAAITEDNPTDYPRLIEIIKLRLAQTVKPGSEEELFNVSCCATLVRLLMIVRKTAEAIEYFEKLKAFTKSSDPAVKREANMYKSSLRRGYLVFR